MMVYVGIRRQPLTIDRALYQRLLADAESAPDFGSRVRYLERWARMWRHQPVDDALMPWADMPPLVRSTTGRACLSHRPRFMMVRPHRTSSEYWCGAMASRVEAAEDDFVCHRCEERAVEAGWPPSGLIPDTGCSATGGARYRKRQWRSA